MTRDERIAEVRREHINLHRYCRPGGTSGMRGRPFGQTCNDPCHRVSGVPVPQSPRARFSK